MIRNNCKYIGLFCILIFLFSWTQVDAKEGFSLSTFTSISSVRSNIIVVGGAAAEYTIIGDLRMFIGFTSLLNKDIKNIAYDKNAVDSPTLNFWTYHSGFRYYQPLTNEWYVIPEFSVGNTEIWYEKKYNSTEPNPIVDYGKSTSLVLIPGISAGYEVYSWFDVSFGINYTVCLDLNYIPTPVEVFRKESIVSKDMNRIDFNFRFIFTF